MKKILFIIMLFIYNNVSSQIVPTLPQYFIVDGDTIGITFSIKQVQQIDNDLELLQLLEYKSLSCDTMVKNYIRVIDNYGREVALLEIKIDNLEKKDVESDNLIKNLNNQIDNYKKELILAKEQEDNYKKIVSNNEKRIRNLKLQRGLIFGGGIVGTVGGILIGVFLIK